MLAYCCFCIPLKIGCLLIGLIYMVLKILDIFDHLSDIDLLTIENSGYLVPQENIEYDIMVLYLNIGLACVRILFALFIMFVSYMEFPLCLKLCCILFALDGFVSFIVSCLSVEMQHSYLFDIVRIVGYFYGGAVLWSYASELEMERSSQEVELEMKQPSQEVNPTV